MKKENERRVQNLNNIKISFGMITLIILSFVSFSGCAAAFLGIGDTASWKEEVLLHDGSKIIVERWQKHGGGSEPGQVPDISDQSITFTIPGTNKTIKWEDEYSREIDRSNFILLALHILNNTPYIITSPRLCLSYNKWGRPNPPYIIFKYENKEWKRIELAELPANFENINLVITTGGDEEKLVSQGVTSAEMVKELNSSLTQEEYKTIARTPLKGVGCRELVTDGKGTWMSIYKFKEQPSYEACLNICNREKFDAEHCPCDKLFKTNSKEK
jgi:hypothetical protein